MSDSIINVRIFSWHFKLSRRYTPSIERNNYHRENGWPDGWFRIYEFPGM